MIARTPRAIGELESQEGYLNNPFFAAIGAGRSMRRLLERSVGRNAQQRK